MGDYASVIGSGPIVGLDDIGKHLDAYYHLVSPNLTLDLNDHTGSNLIDATEESHGFGVFLGSGADTVLGGAADDTIASGAGADEVHAGAGDDSVDAGRGTDWVDGGTGDDSIHGGDGMDSVFGGSGDDLIHGDKGDDLVDGGIGNDRLYGDAGNDTLSGGQGDDLLHGGAGNDLVDGGDGDDALYGDAGADTLIGGAGDDLLYGGAGKDVFLFHSGFGHDTIADLAAGDQLWLAGNINGSGIATPADLAKYVSGSGSTTKITIGSDTIRIEGVGKDDFLANLSHYVKII